jgi:dipeptidyl aminopeptidase/acylaminoacyl peptidase
MTLDIRALLGIPAWRAFDLDDAGRLLAGFDGSGSVQLVELAPDGTATPLTALPGPCSGRYLPGSRTVVVQHDDGGNELSQLSLLDVPDAADGPLGLAGLRPLVHDERYAHHLVDVAEDRVVYATNRRNDVDFDIVVRTLSDGSERVAYDGGGWANEAKTSPDDTGAVVVVPAQNAMSDQLVLADAAAGTIRPLTDWAEPALHWHPHWTPDGSALIVSTDRGRDFVGVARLDLASGAWTWLATDDEHNVTGWPSPDGRRFLACLDDDGAVRLTIRDATDGRVLHETPLPVEGWAVEEPCPKPVWSADSRHVAVTYSAPTVPGDIVLIDATTGEVRTVVSSTAPLAGHVLAEPESHRVPAHDGEQIPCFVYRPPGDVATTSATGSAVIVVHGGPEGQSIRTFSAIYQSLAAAGHTVLVPNVRGSVGYGKRWYSADDVRKRLDSVADLAALHAWLPEIGADPERAALYGGSYGGYMVLAGLAFQPELWASGVAIVAISSLVTFLENTSAYRRTHREREYGSLANDREFLEAASPMTKVDDIRAALLLIHGANDPRVPLSEAEQIAERLGANGVPCDLLVYGDEGHGLARRTNRLDAYPTALEFLGRHLAK